MKIYFYDSNLQYIGNRELLDDEEMPHNATTKTVEVSEDKIAFFEGSEWVLEEKPNDNYSMGDDE